jgi:hypothetical protein
LAVCLLESVSGIPVDILRGYCTTSSVGHATEGEVPPRELNVLALLKGKERYVFIYDDKSRPALIDAFRDQAAEPRLSFNWFDAAVLTDRAREQAPQNWDLLPAPQTLRIQERG